MKRYYLITFLILLCNGISHGQEIINTNSASTPPQIDGIIKPAEWNYADSTSGFKQIEPDKGAAATERTVVWVTYDKENVYFAFKCYQDKGVVANVQTRDKLIKSDDAIMLVLDTYADNRSGYAFVLNPLGTKTDFRITDDGRNKNYDWDMEWNASARTFPWGWSAEMAIPFKNLKYNASTKEWGINFGRIIRHNAETSWWSPEMNDDFRISQGGILTGIQVPAATDRFLVTPYASLRYEDSDISGAKDKLTADAGGDIRFNITPNLNFNATFNPDFASIEGDRQKIDLSGWEISFPEKRLFFQEGNEMFDTRYRLFYSRRIGDINYGGKFTGKAGSYSMNIMSVRSVENQSLKEPAAFFTVARVKKDILKSSTIGFTFVDKSSDTSWVRTYGIDWVLNPGKSWKITGQLMGSSPGDFIKNSGGFLRVAHESNKHHVHIRYSDLGESFKDNINKTGFIRDDDRRELDADLIYKFWLNNKVFKYIRVATMKNAYWGQDGKFRSSKFRENLRFYFDNKFSIDFYYEYENRLVAADYFETSQNSKRFYNYFLRSSLGYNTDESSFASVKYTTGKNFGRKMNIWEGSTSVMIFKKMALNYSVVKLDFDPNSTEDLKLRIERSTLLNIISLDYYFTNDLWLHVFAQSDSHRERIYFYGKFGWRFKPPFGALYLIYAGDDFYDHNELTYMASNTVFLKLTYPVGF